MSIDVPMTEWATSGDRPSEAPRDVSPAPRYPPVESGRTRSYPDDARSDDGRSYYENSGDNRSDYDQREYDRREYSRQRSPPSPKIRRSRFTDNEDLDRDGGEVQVDDGPVGKLYLHSCRQCEPRWSQFSQKSDERRYLEQQMAQKPIVHRHAYNPAQTSWTTTNFTINHPAMRSLLVTALANYQDLDLDLIRWSFAQPFKPMVHRWDQIKELAQAAMAGSRSEEEPDVASAAKLLIEFLGPVLGPSVKALATTRETGKVQFDDLWQIFPPGELVVNTIFGVETICRVVKYMQTRTRQGDSLYSITMEYIDWNGGMCGFSRTVTNIASYNGWVKVMSLAAYPLRFREDADEFKTKLIARGRKFEALRGYHVATCKGSRISMVDHLERLIDGRVIIDAFAYNTIQSAGMPTLIGLQEEVDSKKNKQKPRSPDPPPPRDYVPRARYPEQRRRPSDNRHGRTYPARERERDISPPTPTYRHVDTPEPRPYSRDLRLERDRGMLGPEYKADKSGSKLIGREEDLTPLTDDQCLLTQPWLIAFDLRGKEWVHVRVDDIQDVTWNYDAFDNLVLPNDEKEMAWSFIENKALLDKSFDDFVSDKGRGIIILMFGPPGVGKTYTAEAVADRARVPLYSVSAGSLGTSPAHIEKKLDEALELCKLWNAMLLIDEADVFLASRRMDSLDRNELVSVFLTKLEYYSGILFMTTNRASDIDFAFQSRVDLFLPYYDLTTDARRKVWENFMKHCGRDRFDIDEDGINKLADLSLNGREIKNLIKTSQLLSLNSGGIVSMDCLYGLAQKRVKALELMADAAETKALSWVHA